MADLQDFGAKIGGARKDVWRHRGLQVDDIDQMTGIERQTHIKKDNIWVKPNWEKVIQGGVSQTVAYWQNKVRQSVPPNPPGDDDQSQNNYVKTVGRLRDAVMSVTDPCEIDSFYNSVFWPAFTAPDSGRYRITVIPEAEGIINTKVLRACHTTQREMAREAKKKQFGIPKDQKIYTDLKERLSIHEYDGDTVKFVPEDSALIVGKSYGRSYYYLRNTDVDWIPGTYFVLDPGTRRLLKTGLSTEQEAIDFVEQFARSAQEQVNSKGQTTGKSSSKRKGAFVPPQLQHIQRTGPCYRGIRNADSDLFLKELKFRGGEFGNWLNHEDRQTSLNMAYDALRDLARLLEIHPEDIAFGNKLAIAFGARGRGGANAGAAHYEPDRKVINLTKMSGAGCLAHEWGHALDHAIGESIGTIGLASESRSNSDLPESFCDLLREFRFKTVVLEDGQLTQAEEALIEKNKQGLNGWLKSAKPANLPPDMEDAWNNTVQSILARPEAFHGSEYTRYGREKPPGKAEVELLSKISKLATNHVLNMETKQQICIWARELARSLKPAREKQPRKKLVETDFYLGSQAFDKTFSRAAHGYYQSRCEMFARAFDCYIADKLAEAGLKSDYLSAYANSFVMTDENGKKVAAIPLGEERTSINRHFDRLFSDLKTRGLLHSYVEEPIKTQQGRDAAPVSRPTTSGPETQPQACHYQQLSLDEILFSAQNRTASVLPQNGRTQDNLDR